MHRSSGRVPIRCPVVVDPATSAKVAGLRYVHDRMPGIRRVGSGKKYRFLGPDGKAVRDGETLARIRSLVIPPAWTDVWICKDANGHLQATGRDARGRKQFRYHPRWREVRDETKYGRILVFGQRLPRIRARIARDLKKPGLSREKVLATLVRLLETTLIRVGNEEYARQNRSFGLTTMRDRHAKIKGSEVRFEFTGKSGVKHSVSIRDRRLAKLVQRCQDVPGQELFQYLDEQGNRHTVDSADVNAYLKEIAGEEFTAKDFRTWAGTVLAAAALREFEKFDSQTQAKKNVVAAIESVAKKLGNTKTICRKCYVHPVVVEAYMDGTLRDHLQERAKKVLTQSLHDLTPEEAAVLAFLSNRLATSR
ncbi:MAG: DNA topoisomerase IB [Gemmataceae bacterium]|nr:DNA topoisomerase IB [Gemmataceae bacterium]